MAALPQTTATVTLGAHTSTDSGVSLETLVLDAMPAYPATLANTKNELLRVTATVRSTGGQQVTFAPTGSSLVVVDGTHQVTLTTKFLKSLPSETLTVSFLGPVVSRPTPRSPAAVAGVGAAGVPATLDTWVAAVGDDNYMATATPAEQLVSGRHSSCPSTRTA